MDSLRIRFGKLLKEYRTKAGFTQEALAIDCDLDRTYISLLERGKRQPTIDTIFAICGVLGISPSALVRELEKPGGRA